MNKLPYKFQGSLFKGGPREQPLAYIYNVFAFISNMCQTDPDTDGDYFT